MLSFLAQCARRAETRTRPAFLFFGAPLSRIHAREAHSIREERWQTRLSLCYPTAFTNHGRYNGLRILTSLQTTFKLMLTGEKALLGHVF